MYMKQCKRSNKIRNLIHYNKQRVHIQYNNKIINIFIERIENFINFIVELSNVLD